jgi:two-component system, OmpR family, sensor histidine kinase MprB
VPAVTLRKRLSLIAAASVGAAVLIAVVVCYMVVRSQLHSQVDGSLRAQEAAIGASGVIQNGVPSNSANSGGPAPYNQIVLADGFVYRSDPNGIPLPSRGHVLQIAKTQSGSDLRDLWVGGVHLRLLAFPGEISFGPQTVPAVIELARPLNGTDMILSHLRVVLVLLLLGGMGAGAALGRVAARRVLAPLGEVAGAAQHIGETEDLSSRLRVHADDEVGQLATRFNTMLDRLESSRSALDESVRAQRQLIADASHELRTPVTSLRTNIEVLLQEAELDPEDRRRLLTDVVEQSEELSSLVNDLIELARGDRIGADTEDVRLDVVAGESVARARRNSPGIEFVARLQPVIVDGVAERLARAINNLLDNAARHSPPGGPVEVSVNPEGVTVRDHGHGVPPDDLPYVFDRFFRGTNSRGAHGSGLGLAIVRQVTEQHGGSASAANAPDGGAVFTLHLPGVALAPEEAAAEDAIPVRY